MSGTGTKTYQVLLASTLTKIFQTNLIFNGDLWRETGSKNTEHNSSAVMMKVNWSVNVLVVHTTKKVSTETVKI